MVRRDISSLFERLRMRPAACSDVAAVPEEEAIVRIVRLILICLALFIGYGASFTEQALSASYTTISPEKAFSYIEKSPDVFILDVRTPEEFNRKHLPDAVNIPVDELSGRVDELPENKALLIYCRSGIRAENAARMLEPLMPGREIFVVKGFIFPQ